MKSIYKYVCLLGGAISLISACKSDEDFLVIDTTNKLSNEQVWNDKVLATGAIANLYSAIQGDFSTTNMLLLDEAVPGPNDANSSSISNSQGQIWRYDYIRNLNISLDLLAASTKLDANTKKEMNAEIRFLRAYAYFEHVKAMGGVPLILNTLVYNFDNEVDHLQFPRSTETQLYDYIIAECDALVPLLGNSDSQSRVNKWVALALKSRAALYAGSIAKYNALKTPTVVTAGGEVGISSTLANAYFQKSLDASRAIITSGVFTLYNVDADKGVNFYNMYKNQLGNREVIWAKQFKVPGANHNFTYNNIARSVREDNLSSSGTVPTLNMVEAFEYITHPTKAGTLTGTLDGVGDGSTSASGATQLSKWKLYDNAKDIFAGKDARLYGTVAYPGETFRDSLDIQAGLYIWNSTTSRYDRLEGALNSYFVNPGGNTNPAGWPAADGRKLTGGGGPQRAQAEISNTGFYLRKLIDNTLHAGERGTGTNEWWVRFRLGEIYLNAAEASMELAAGPSLNDALSTPEAVGYINALRQRAGFPANNLTTVSRDRLRNERRVELAYEDHRFYDVRRWRVGHELFTGGSLSLSNVSTTMSALYPYRIVRPGDPSNGKWVFDKIVAPRFKNTRSFTLQNYYSTVSQNVIDNNPKITKNPFQ